MKRNGSKLLLFTITSLATFADAGGWKKEKTDDGKVSVEYRISNSKDAAGEDAPLIEYNASMIDSADFRNCVSALMDVSNHRKINDDESSETIKTVSDTEWIVRYNMKIPWPLPKTDCVLRMTYSRDTLNRSAEFAFIAAPDQAPSAGRKRFSNHRVSYTIRDLGDGKVELRSVAKSSPPFKLPLWMISANFPDGPADPLKNIVKLAKAGR
jgi:hypothetical protein